MMFSNHRSAGAVLFMFVLLLFSSFATGQEVIDRVQPSILVDFDEAVSIVGSSLLNTASSDIYEVDMVAIDDKTFKFTPKKPLQNGIYKFGVTAADILGNTDVFNYEFEVNVPESDILLVEPRLGYSNSTQFDFKIMTPVRSAECKYRFTSILSFDQMGLSEFDASDGTMHTKQNMSVQEDFPRDIFVVCIDELGREVFADFTLHTDLTPPDIARVSFDPFSILEYPLYSNYDMLISVMTPQASEPVICKYSNESEDEYDMMIPFQDFNRYVLDSFIDAPSEQMFFPDMPLKKTYYFYVQCEDRAGWKSNKKTASILLDLTAALDLRVNTPAPASRETSFMLNLTTNKLAYCTYRFGDEGPYSSMSTSSDNLDRVHLSDSMTRSSGEYTVSFYCFSDISGEPEELWRDYTFMIDTNAPSKPSVNLSSDLICDDYAEVSFESSDDLSGVDHYVWTFGSSDGIINNGETSDTELRVSEDSDGKDIEFNESVSYYFEVHAVDKAGNVGPKDQSSPIRYAQGSAECDKLPPEVFLTKTAEGTFVEMSCYDDMTGCTSQMWAYAVNSSDCAEKSFSIYDSSFMIPLYESTNICYQAVDGANNVAEGYRFFNFNNSVDEEGNPTCDEGIDNDGDGYGWGCSNGYDCDDTNPEVHVGCSSGCRQDTDGDGYGWGCILGPDCNDNDGNESTVCTNGCISDNDGDGYGLGCFNGADCNGLDPLVFENCVNGCFDDNDGDGYGFGCMAGLDCNGEDENQRTFCANGCLSDMDGDGYGLGCENGADCDGMNPDIFENCDDGCLSDEDGDGFGLGCSAGDDCNGVNPSQQDTCLNGCVLDSDGDGYGLNCSKGDDCNDLDPVKFSGCTSGCSMDLDGDGFGLCCYDGADCDDYDFTLTSECTGNCTFDIDCDSMGDVWELKHNLSVGEDDSEGDVDGDDFSNLDEFCSGQDPNVFDEKAFKDTGKENEESDDSDEDGVPDKCEKAHPDALSIDDPFDGGKDYDGDGLTNSFECNYLQGSCFYGLNPEKMDTDDDGYNDKEEVDAGTDPCDPDSKPSSIIGWIILLLGILQLIGATNWWIYKKYYIPLGMPASQPQRARAPSGMQGVGAVRRPAPRPVRQTPREKLSREKFFEAQKKKAQEREKMFDVFGAKKPSSPRKVMERIAKKPQKRTFVPVAPKPKVKPLPSHIEDNVSKLSRVIEQDSFGKLSKLSEGQVDGFHRLAKIVKNKQESKLESDQVEQLAKITKKASAAGTMDQLVKAAKKSDIDRLADLSATKKDIDSFIDEHSKKKDAISEMETLSASSKEKDVFDALESITKKGVSAAKIAELQRVSSKAGLENVIRSISKQGHVDKNVFQVLLQYLVKAGKITKKDVYDILMDLEKQGVLDKKDVSEVFFNMGIKR